MINTAAVSTIIMLLAIVFAGCSENEFSKPDQEQISGYDLSGVKTARTIPESSNVRIVGCWSSLSGKNLVISETTIISSTDKQARVGYDVERSTDIRSDSELLVLRLTDRPEFYYFQEYLTIESLPDHDGARSIRIENFRSRKALINRQSSGGDTWQKFDCEE